MRGILITIVLLQAGCFSSARFDQAHATRVHQINAEQDRRRAEVLKDAQELLELIYQRRKYLAPVKPGSQSSPLTRIDTRPEMEKFRALCASYDGHIEQAIALGQDPSALKQGKDDCEAKYYREIYVPLLVSTYYKADAQWAIRTYLENPERYDIEALFLYSHNKAISQEIDRDVAQVVALRDWRLQRIESWRLEEISYSAAERDREVSLAREEHRRRMQAVGAALGSLSSASSSSSPSASATYPSYSSSSWTQGGSSTSRTRVNLCPDGSYVSGPCTLAPNGQYVGGRPQLAPDGSYVTGRPTLAPDGTYVGGNGKVVMCPDGSYAGGTRCTLAPNGTYVGE